LLTDADRSSEFGHPFRASGADRRGDRARVDESNAATLV
jgi:hypothetical protein